LAAWPRHAYWKDWLDRLTLLAGKTLERPDTVLGVLSELHPMGEVGPVTLDEVRVALAGCLGSLGGEPSGPRYGKVFVGPVEEARGRAFDVVFVPGLAEGVFPRPAFEDPLLLDEARRRLDAALADQDRRFARERLLLVTVAGAARSRLIASYPRLDAAIGRPRVPSFYALELWRAAEGSLPDLPELEERAAGGAPAQLGWPAPLDTADAVDDAEYDLSFLGQLLREGRGAERGASHYLLQANSHLARSLRARAKRWRKKWFDADGIVDPDQSTRDLLAARSLRARAYSPTALQQFAACPYKFLLYAIHHLRRRETAAPLEQIDPLTRGSLYHEAQYELFRELEAAGLIPVNQENLPKVLDFADQVVNRVAAKYEEDLAPAIAQVWRTGMEEIRIDLRGWVFELPGVHAEWLPAQSELAFGEQGQVVVPGGFRLRGRVDLVERHVIQDLLRVTDHKTGRAPPRGPVSVGGGEALQPALYGLAVEQLLSRTVQAGRLYYATQRGGYRVFEIALGAARPRAALVLETIENALQQGFLPAAPRPEACTYCDYRPVCGPYEERRVQDKDQERLEPLLAVRLTP